MWAHVVWQNHKLPPWEFFTLDEKKKAFLIASEQIEIERRKAEAAKLKKGPKK